VGSRRGSAIGLRYRRPDGEGVLNVSDAGAAATIAVVSVVAIASFVVWIWALVDAVKVPDDSMYKNGNKLVWILVIVLAGVIGAIVYLVVGRPSPGARAASPPSPYGQTPPPPPGSIG
jgi:Phospholipase_D-nuclease N-terminal